MSDLDQGEQRLVEEALAPFLFKKVTPNLTRRVREALAPVLDRIVRQRMGEIEVECVSTEDDVRQGILRAQVRRKA